MSLIIFYKEVADKKVKDYDPEIIAWQRKDIEGPYRPLLYIFPQPGDNIKQKKYFAVKNYEKAIFYNKGELVGVLKGGVYELDKKAKIKGTEIVWIDTSFIVIQWGIPLSSGIPTKDGFIIGLHGDLKLKISDVKTFYSNLIAGRGDWRVKDLKNFINSLIQTSLRDIFKNDDAKNIILEDRERVISLVTSKIAEEFLRYGLELDTFNIVGIQAPLGAQELFELEKQKTVAKSEESKSNLDNQIERRKELQKRIKNLKEKINKQQDLLLDDQITQEEYEKKKKQIQAFIKEAVEELQKK